MREQWSVFKLQVRRKMPKAMLVFFVVVVVGSLGYWLLGFRHNDAAEMQKFLEDIASGENTADAVDNARSFSNGGSSLYIEILCAIGFFGTVWACIDFPVKKFKPVYTVRRLRTSETGMFWWDVLINTVLFLVAWVCAIALIFIAGRIYEAGAGFVEGPQGITAAVVRNGFYRGIVPVVYPWLVLRNVIAAVCCGYLCAGASYRLQNRSTPLIEGVLIAMMYIAIPLQIDVYNETAETVYRNLLWSWVWRVLLVALMIVFVLRDTRSRKEA